MGDRYERLKDVFFGACELSAAERSAYLNAACGCDASLRAEVEKLLALDVERPDFLRTSPDLGNAFGHAVDALRAESSPPPSLPSAIGGYHVLRVIGRGGLSVVYLAEQENPRRTVALKVIKPGLASDEAYRRLEYEAQVLARLQHPGIAQVFEAGTADTGQGLQPFFAMEYIEGRRLTDYADAAHLDTRRRLELLARICDAVHHGHQRGVIHRDLKPANILVDGSGQPKVIDFGVARIVDSDVARVTMQTAVGQLVGTLAYMSPEQVLGDPRAVDTRADVYALGVIGYELLTGRPPYDLSGKLVPEAARVICDEDPRAPSTINHALRGDVDTIIRKALEKETSQRYSSASELAADIRRFLGDEPIQARPPSNTYQLKKFARRNKAFVVGVAIAFFGLVAGTLFAGWKAVEATTARNHAVDAERRALTEAGIAEQVAQFLRGMLGSADPMSLGAATSMREVLDQAAAEMEGRFADRPEIAAALHSTIGNAYENLGVFDKAQHHLEIALRLYRGSSPNDARPIAACLADFGLVLYREGAYDPAEPLVLEAVTRASTDPIDPVVTVRALNTLARIQHAKGKFADAAKTYDRALTTARQHLGDESLDLAFTLHNRATLALDTGKPAEAEALVRKALSMRRRLLRPNHPGIAETLNMLGSVLFTEDDVPGAESCWRESLEIFSANFAPDHPAIATVRSNLALVLERQGKLADAEAELREALSHERKQFGDDSTAVSSTLLKLATLLSREGNAAGAESAARESLAIRRRVQGNEHIETARAENRLAIILHEHGKSAEAVPLLRDALEIEKKAVGETSDDVASALSLLGSALTQCGKAAEAEPALRRSLEIRRQIRREGDWLTANSASGLGACLTALGRYEEAEPLLLSSIADLTKALGDSHPRTRDGLLRLAELYDAWQKPERAAEWRSRLETSKAH
ncbi:MAG: tetratricopeptide repeat protein [Planctomycetes bacterium]|nr:tetratricopeptide repeat protein [Planctomycetota bacterium]